MKKLYRVEGDFDVMVNWGQYFGSGSAKQEENKNISDKKSKGTKLVSCTLCFKIIPIFFHRYSDCNIPIFVKLCYFIEGYNGYFQIIFVIAKSEIEFRFQSHFLIFVLKHINLYL